MSGNMGRDNLRQPAPAGSAHCSNILGQSAWSLWLSLRFACVRLEFNQCAYEKICGGLVPKFDGINNRIRKRQGRVGRVQKLQPSAVIKAELEIIFSAGVRVFRIKLKMKLGCGEFNFLRASGGNSDKQGFKIALPVSSRVAVSLRGLVVGDTFADVRASVFARIFYHGFSPEIISA
jgi:hypothetical protein